jgi:Putative DNA-binding domain
MANPSLAQYFFDEIKNAADPFCFLSSLVNSTPPIFEEEWREFKRADDIKSDDVQRNWSKALSAFANTGGGVLIWGIEAKRNPGSERDCASGLALIDDPAALKSRLMQLHHQATDPPVQDITVEPYIASSGKGFVVCHIPEGNFKPYRAEQDGKKQFYLRAGDDFVIMPVPVLRSMFYPRVKPNLQIETRFFDPGDGTNVNWSFRIYNTGTATARDVIVYVRLPVGSFGHPRCFGYCTKGAADASLGQGILCNQPIHPGAWLDLGELIEQTGPRELYFANRKQFAFQTYADNNDPQAAVVTFQGNYFHGPKPKFATPVQAKRVRPDLA